MNISKLYFAVVKNEGVLPKKILPSEFHKILKKTSSKISPLKADIVEISKKSLPVPSVIKGKSVDIKCIESEANFKKIIGDLLSDSSYKPSWKRAGAVSDYEKAILPYAGRGDISNEINAFLREGRLPATSGIKQETIENYVRTLEYALKQLDREYGSYSGIVYRYGHFSDKTPNFVSTSDKMTSVLQFASEASKSGSRAKDFHIILTNHGHKINAMHKKMGSKFAESESEILLDPGKVYKEVVSDTPETAEMKKCFFEKFKEFFKGNNVSTPNLRFWREI